MTISMANFYRLERSDNLNEGYSKQFSIEGEDMLLVHSGGVTRLISSLCPHDGYPLKKAKLAKGCIQCPKHRISFRLDNGEALGGDAVADVASLKRFEIAQQGDDIGIYI